MTPLNRKFWMRARLRHTPAHVVDYLNGDNVLTMCGWEPEAGGVVVDRDEVRDLEAFACTLCARRMNGQHR